MQGNRQLEALFVARPIEKREMAGHESRNVAVLARHGFDRRQVISRSAREAVDGGPFSAHARGLPPSFRTAIEPVEASTCGGCRLR